MTVQWNQSNTTQNYTVQAASAAGVNSTCESSESCCSFLNLTCGQLYTFTVVGHSNMCMSEMSDPIEKLTGKLNSPSNHIDELNFKPFFSCLSFSQPHVLPPMCRLNTTAPRVKLWSAGATQLYPQATVCWRPPAVRKTPPAATWAPPVSSRVWPVDSSIPLLWRQCTADALVPLALLSRSPQVIRARMQQNSRLLTRI